MGVGVGDGEVKRVTCPACGCETMPPPEPLQPTIAATAIAPAATKTSAQSFIAGMPPFGYAEFLQNFCPATAPFPARHPGLFSPFRVQLKSEICLTDACTSVLTRTPTRRTGVVSTPARRRQKIAAPAMTRGSS